MNISEEQYKIVFTNDAVKDMENIFEYISNMLYSIKSAKKLMRKIDRKIENLKIIPRAYKVIKKYPELELEYRRIVVNNYVILYSLFEKEKKVYIMHLYYAKSNYFNKI